MLRSVSSMASCVFGVPLRTIGIRPTASSMIIFQRLFANNNVTGISSRQNVVTHSDNRKWVGAPVDGVPLSPDELDRLRNTQRKHFNASLFQRVNEPKMEKEANQIDKEQLKSILNQISDRVDQLSLDVKMLMEKIERI